MLYLEYLINEMVGKGKHPVVNRFYLLDGEAASQTELLERMEQESLFYRMLELSLSGLSFQMIRKICSGFAGNTKICSFNLCCSIGCLENTHILTPSFRFKLTP